MENLEKKQLERIRMFISLFGDETLTKEDFVQSFAKVIEHIKGFETKTSDTIKAIYDELITLHDQLKKDNINETTELKKTVDDLVAEKIASIDAKISEIDSKIADVRDGEDADPAAVVPLVIAALPTAKETILDGPIELRDKLETLEGEEQLNPDAIKGLTDTIDGLRKEIEDLKKHPVKMGRMGMRKVPIVKSVNLSGQLNGVKKSFALPADTVQVLGVWGTEFPITFNGGVDWTVSGTTLTLTANQVSPPATGQTLFCLVETLFY